LLSIVTSMKPAAFEVFACQDAGVISHRGHPAPPRRALVPTATRQIGGGTGVHQHMIIEPQQCIDRERESRRCVNAADFASIDVAGPAFAIMLC
jgi:hypothetical protein